MPATEGNRVDVLHNGDDLPCGPAIRSAKETVDFLTFVYWEGSIGEEIAEALGERAPAGVRVRALLDALGSYTMNNPLIEDMDRAGCEVERFRPVNKLRFRENNHRTHRKVIICDEPASRLGHRRYNSRIRLGSLRLLDGTRAGRSDEAGARSTASRSSTASTRLVAELRDVGGGGEAHPAEPRPLPEWPKVHVELRRPGVTLMLLWLEYRETFPDGYAYSQFCARYRRWQRHIDVGMRQEHKAGERLLVDFPGRRIPIRDDATPRTFEAELFVAVLGASSYLYAEALPSRELMHWVTAHVHASNGLGDARRSWCATTFARASPARTATSPTSTPSTRRWPPTTC